MSIEAQDRPRYEKLGLKFNPFGVSMVTLKEAPTFDKIRAVLGLEYIYFYGYTHTTPTSSRDVYYYGDWKRLDVAFKELAAKLNVELPEVSGYLRVNMEINGTPLIDEERRKIDDWEEQQWFIVGFATALRTVEVADDLLPALRKMVDALDNYFISVQWQ